MPNQLGASKREGVLVAHPMLLFDVDLSASSVRSLTQLCAEKTDQVIGRPGPNYL